MNNNPYQKERSLPYEEPVLWTKTLRKILTILKASSLNKDLQKILTIWRASSLNKDLCKDPHHLKRKFPEQRSLERSLPSEEPVPAPRSATGWAGDYELDLWPGWPSRRGQLQGQTAPAHTRTPHLNRSCRTDISIFKHTLWVLCAMFKSGERLLAAYENLYEIKMLDEYPAYEFKGCIK